MHEGPWCGRARQIVSLLEPQTFFRGRDPQRESGKERAGSGHIPICPYTHIPIYPCAQHALIWRPFSLKMLQFGDFSIQMREFGDFLQRFSDLDSGQIDNLLSLFIGEKLIEKEVKDFKLNYLTNL